MPSVFAGSSLTAFGLDASKISRRKGLLLCTDSKGPRAFEKLISRINVLTKGQLFQEGDAIIDNTSLSWYFLLSPDVPHQPFSNFNIANMASASPSLESQTARPETATAEVNASVDDSKMASSMSELEDASPPPNRPNQPKMTPRAIGQRRRRNASRAVTKSLQGQYSLQALHHHAGDFLSPSSPFSYTSEHHAPSSVRKHLKCILPQQAI